MAEVTKKKQKNRIIKKTRLDLRLGRTESIGSDDSVSQLQPYLPTPSESIPQGSNRSLLTVYNHPNQTANPVLSSLINGFGLNFVSLHFQANYGDLSETDRYLRIERYKAFNVAGKSQIQQEQLQQATGNHI